MTIILIYSTAIKSYLRLKILQKFIHKQNHPFLSYYYRFYIYFLIPEIFKTNFKTGFLVHKHLLNLCFSAVDSQRLLCSQKACVKCSYKSFLVYKYNCLLIPTQKGC